MKGYWFDTNSGVFKFNKHWQQSVIKNKIINIVQGKSYNLGSLYNNVAQGNSYDLGSLYTNIAQGNNYYKVVN